MKIRYMKVDEAGKVDEFLSKYMYTSEPLAMNVDPKDIPEPGKGFGTAFASQCLSKIAEAEDGVILGVCLNDTFPQPMPYIYSFSQRDEKFQKIFEYIEKESQVNEIARNAMELRMLIVRPVSRQCGVGSELVQESVKAARAAGFPWVKMYCTSEYSSRMILKKGWTLLYSISYKDLRDRVVSDLQLPSEPHTNLNLYIRATSD